MSVGMGIGSAVNERRLNTGSRARFAGFIRISALAACVLGGGGSIQAATLNVPNFSFEQQPAPASSPFVNVFIDSWQKAPEPSYYAAAIGTPFGIPWIGTSGVFLDVNPYANRVGSQAGYLLGFPQVAIHQNLNATFEAGMSYDLTIGVFGKNTLAPGSTLALSLYYLDGTGNRVPVQTTTVTYSQAQFPTAAPLNLVDFSVAVPTVQPGDAWAGRPLGIQIESTASLQLATGGNWDFDNVRLKSIPEPGVLGLASLGVGMMYLARRRANGKSPGR